MTVGLKPKCRITLQARLIRTQRSLNAISKKKFPKATQKSRNKLFAATHTFLVLDAFINWVLPMMRAQSPACLLNKVHGDK